MNKPTMKKFLTLITLFNFSLICAQDVAILKYKGGGDWYSNPTALPNLVRYCNDNIDTNINEMKIFRPLKLVALIFSSFHYYI